MKKPQHLIDSEQRRAWVRAGASQGSISWSKKGRFGLNPLEFDAFGKWVRNLPAFKRCNGVRTLSMGKIAKRLDLPFSGFRVHEDCCISQFGGNVVRRSRYITAEQLVDEWRAKGSPGYAGPPDGYDSERDLFTNI